MVTHVVWLSYHYPEIIARGYWDQGLLEDTFKVLGNCEHHDGMSWHKKHELAGDKVGAIVIINGRTHVEDTAKINADIEKLAWVLFIDTGDEEANFPWREVKHPLMKVWMMLPRMNQHDDVAYFLPNGYRPTTRAVLKEAGYSDRNIDYCFIGQVNHPRREQCVDVLKQFHHAYPSSVVVGTDGFGKEVVAYDQYLAYLRRTKLVPCPSGIESPDNFRLYEALEAGCLPIVDAFSTNNQTPGFWKYLFYGDVLFPVVSYWDKFPDMIPQLLAEWPERSAKCFAWWQQKKREIKYRMLDDVKELSR